MEETALSSVDTKHGHQPSNYRLRQDSGLESVHEDEEDKETSHAGDGNDQNGMNRIGSTGEDGGHELQGWAGQKYSTDPHELESLVQTAELLREFGGDGFARTSSAPAGENMEAMLLSTEEAARSRQVSDDSKHDDGRQKALRESRNKGKGHRFLGQ